MPGSTSVTLLGRFDPLEPLGGSLLQALGQTRLKLGTDANKAQARPDGQ